MTDTGSPDRYQARRNGHNGWGIRDRHKREWLPETFDNTERGQMKAERAAFECNSGFAHRHGG